ncbi:MAG: hypothetical protein ACYCS4_11085 [Acidimicrobiales bacterium]
MSSRHTGLLAGLAVLGLAGLVVTGLVLTSGPPSPSTSTSTSAAHPPTPTAVSVCSALLDAVASTDWQTPALPATELEQWATPALADQLAADHHLTPGQVAQHVVITATARAISPPVPMPGGVDVILSLTLHVPVGGVVAATPSQEWVCGVVATQGGTRVAHLAPGGV